MKDVRESVDRSLSTAEDIASKRSDSASRLTARATSGGQFGRGRVWRSRCVLVVLSVVLVGCAQQTTGSQSAEGAGRTAAAGNAATTGVTAGSEVFRDLAYASPEPAGSRGHLLDLYLPERTGQPVPVVLWSHGSGWLRENGRDGADTVAARLNPLGIAVAGLAIRSSATAQFPGQLHDIKAAIRFLKNDAERYGLDPDRFATMGESSGGWATTMAAVTGNVPQLEGDLGVTGPSSRVAAAVPFYPPTDFLQMDAHMIDCPFFNSLFGLADCHSDPKSPESLLLARPITTCPDRVAEANPITHVDRDDPPFLILHGTSDRLVPHHQSELLLSAFQTACVDATFVSVPGGEHGVWDQWLDGRVTSDGTSATATTACQSRTQSASPNWDTVIAFLRRTIIPT